MSSHELNELTSMIEKLREAAIRDRAEGLHARKGTAAKAFNAVLLDQSTKIKAAASREKEEYTRALRSVLENLKAREEALDSAVMDTESAIAHELDAVKNAFAEFSALCERKNSDLNGIAAASTKQLTELVTVIAEKELSSMEDDFAVMVEERKARVLQVMQEVNQALSFMASNSTEEDPSDY